MSQSLKTEMQILQSDLPKDHPCADAHRIRLLQAADDLLVTNADEINRVLVDSSKQARTVGLAIKYDISSGHPEVGLRLTISRESKKDSRRVAAEDPEQLPIQFEHKAADPEAEAEPQPKKRTKKAKAE